MLLVALSVSNVSIASPDNNFLGNYSIKADEIEKITVAIINPWLLTRAPTDERNISTSGCRIETTKPEDISTLTDLVENYKELDTSYVLARGVRYAIFYEKKNGTVIDFYFNSGMPYSQKSLSGHLRIDKGEKVYQNFDREIIKNLMQWALKSYTSMPNNKFEKNCDFFQVLETRKIPFTE